MPRKPKPWFRFYTETITDRKIVRLPVAQRWLWAAVLAAARESPEPGRLLVAEGLPMTHAELAKYADVRPRDVAQGLAAFQAMKMADIEANGAIVVTNFPKRQFESDNVTARTAAHRERSNEHRRNVPTNGLGTFLPSPLERPPTRGRATETETETEERWLSHQ